MRSESNELFRATKIVGRTSNFLVRWIFSYFLDVFLRRKMIFYVWKALRRCKIWFHTDHKRKLCSEEILTALHRRDEQFRAIFLFLSVRFFFVRSAELEFLRPAEFCLRRKKIKAKNEFFPSENSFRIFDRSKKGKIYFSTIPLAETEIRNFFQADRVFMNFVHSFWTKIKISFSVFKSKRFFLQIFASFKTHFEKISFSFRFSALFCVESRTRKEFAVFLQNQTVSSFLFLFSFFSLLIKKCSNKKKIKKILFEIFFFSEIDKILSSSNKL